MANILDMISKAMHDPAPYSDREIADWLIAHVKSIAFSMPAPNEFTPRLVQAAVEAESMLNLAASKNQ